MGYKGKSYRRIFYIVNLIFWIVGCCSLAVGIYFYIEHRTYASLVPSSYSAMSTAGLCVSTGCTVLIIAFVGCIGTSISSKWLLYLYHSFLSLLLVVQLITGIMGFLHDNSARERVKQSLYTTINRTYAFGGGSKNSFQLTWDYMQQSLRCCGVDNYTDWHFASRWKQNRFVPDSCCDPAFFASDTSTKNCGTLESNAPRFFQQGCQELFADWILHHLLLVKVFSVLFVLVEIVLFPLAILMVIDINQRRHAKIPNYRYSNQNGDEGLIAED